MKIKLPAVRLSFPSLFQHETFGGESTGKYAASFILDKKDHAAVIAQIQDAMLTMQKVELKTKLSADKIALKDGDETDHEELQGKYTIKASTKKRPMVLGKDKSPVVEEDNVFYPGCYVNAIITLWAQNNTYGKRINASLEGVMFAKDGETFGEGGVSSSDFEDFEDGEDDDFM